MLVEACGNVARGVRVRGLESTRECRERDVAVAHGDTGEESLRAAAHECGVERSSAGFARGKQHYSIFVPRAVAAIGEIRYPELVDRHPSAGVLDQFAVAMPFVGRGGECGMRSDVALLEHKGHALREKPFEWEAFLGGVVALDGAQRRRGVLATAQRRSERRCRERVPEAAVEVRPQRAQQCAQKILDSTVT